MLHTEIIQMLNRKTGRGSSMEEIFTSKSFFEEEIQLFELILQELCPHSLILTTADVVTISLSPKPILQNSYSVLETKIPFSKVCVSSSPVLKFSCCFCCHGTATPQNPCIPKNSCIPKTPVSLKPLYPLPRLLL